ncbi:MAG: D-glycero-beta-D-manno-heptose 1-phosphate adenylyltransferase [Gemmatales bacterium]|nr:D-glycero-beta-D-manno-heptose 1-phosphate adenylyltransferase [Gemmatales bacterium]MDW8387911.1 D-glycero-beta-D-manno-heptose 1-phosphate adenylyltransferase [Gemmatales bacterium]
MSADLIHLVQHLGQPDVLVVGDVMLDRYIFGDAERISQEAPVVLLRADRREERLGGASSVATMLRALGARTALAGVVGADADAARIRRLLTDLNIDHDCVLVDANRPSTVKERYIGRAQARHPQQMLRVDFEVRDPLDAAIEERMKQAVESRIRRADVLLISDYDKGVCTPGLLQHVIGLARSLGRRVLVDPIRCKPGQGDSSFAKYRGCSSMTPNRLEAGLAVGKTLATIDDALSAADELRQRLDMEAGIVTLDKDGMALAHRDGRRKHFPTRPRQVYDITGAGDMVLCVLGMALAAGADYDAAIRLANVAGGLEVEKLGVAPVTRDEILRDLRHGMLAERESRPGSKIVDRATLVQEIEALRCGGKRIGFTNGCFDLLHAGHVQYLQEAKAQADILIVGLNSDAGVRSLKGPERPINPEAARAEVLAALACVDYVTLFDEPTPLELIRLIRPDVLIKGADYRKDQVVGADFVESYGGKVYLAPLKAGFSTTALAERLAESRPRRVA